jgi:CRP-like cAMP-binding protein
MASCSNHILAALVDDDEYSSFLRNLIAVPLSVDQVLSAPGIPMKHAYFVTGGMACILTGLKDGTTVSDQIIGSEGFIGIPLVLESDRLSVAGTVVQVAGSAMRIDVASLRETLKTPGKLNQLLHRYVLAHIVHLMQAAACNRLHSIRERLACLLLMTSDRVGEDFRITHERIAEMLGSRRATITIEAERFQDKGLLNYRYGHMTIVKRKGLQQIACECYAVYRDELADLLRS